MNTNNDGVTLNHLISPYAQEAIKRLWKSNGMKGRPPHSYHTMLMRIQRAGVDITGCEPPPLWGTPLSEWQIEVAGFRTPQEFINDKISKRLSKKGMAKVMAANAAGAAEAKVNKNIAIINDYKEAHSLSETAIPSAYLVGKWYADTNRLDIRQRRNLVKRLRNTGRTS